MEGLAHTHAGDTRAVLLPAALLALVPVELRLALLECVAQVGARDHGAPAVGTRAAGRAIHRVVLLADGDAIQPEVTRGPVHQRFHDAGQLVLPGTALRGARR